MPHKTFEDFLLQVTRNYCFKLALIFFNWDSLHELGFTLREMELQEKEVQKH